MGVRKGFCQGLVFPHMAKNDVSGICGLPLGLGQDQAFIFPEGPRWVLDLEDRKLAKSRGP